MCEPSTRPATSKRCSTAISTSSWRPTCGGADRRRRRVTLALAMIRLETVTKTYDKGNVVALQDVNLDIQNGEFVYLVGPSGSGKSTFLRPPLEDDEPHTERISVAGMD